MTTEQQSSIGQVVVSWYKSNIARDDGAARSARARLKRCQSPAEALAIAQTHELNRQLTEKAPDAQRHVSADVLALLATIFAHLGPIDDKKLLASKFGFAVAKESPRLLSEARFQSLIRIKNHRDLITPLRRSLKVLGLHPACNGYRLAQDLYFWNEHTRNQWCFQYFGTDLTETNNKETV